MKGSKCESSLEDLSPEHGAESDLGLSEAHVSAKQPVHGNLPPDHVVLDLHQTPELDYFKHVSYMPATPRRLGSEVSKNRLPREQTFARSVFRSCMFVQTFSYMEIYR